MEQQIILTTWRTLQKQQVSFLDLLRYHSHINRHEIQFIRKSTVDTQMLGKFVVVACYLTTRRFMPLLDGTLNARNVFKAMCWDFNDFRKHKLSGDLKASLLNYFQRCAEVGFSHNDVVTLQITQSLATPYEPFFVVFKQGNVVTVSVRGTITFGDCLTDNDGYPVEQEFRGQKVFVHRGFLKMGEKVIQHLKEKNLLDGHEVVFTGHSMGGSISTVCSYLMAREGKTCKAISFSPAPALSENLCDMLQDRVTSVVFERDGIPQASIHAAKTAINRVRDLKKGLTPPDHCAYSKLNTEPDHFFVAGTVVMVWKGQFYEVDRHQIGELSLQFQTLTDHAGASYVAECCQVKEQRSQEGYLQSQTDFF
ncbi:Lipase_class 3 family protein [Hexamita inflata]|uniref:sn-1-specific diacylglycerol lipase n=1 Tax=Hexamita inflata TaxID=28002 RepID=A0ABP1KCH4_9EUKA